MKKLIALVLATLMLLSLLSTAFAAEYTSDNTADDASSWMPQELVDLTGGMPDTLDELGEMYDLETLKTIYEQVDIDAVLHDLLDQDTATLPDLSVEWTGAYFCVYYGEGFEDGEVYDIALDSAENVTTISQKDPFKPNGQETHYTLCLHSSGGDADATFNRNVETDELYRRRYDVGYTMVANETTMNYHNVFATLIYDNGFFHYFISGTLDSGEGEDEKNTQWYSSYSTDNGECIDRQKH